MTEPPPSEGPFSEEPRSRRRQELSGGILPPRMDESQAPRPPRAGEGPEEAISQRHGEGGPASRSDRMMEPPEGPLSRRLSDDFSELRPPRSVDESGVASGRLRTEAEVRARSHSVPPISDMQGSRRPTMPPISDSPISMRWGGDASLLSGGAASRRWSEPPPSWPLSARGYEGPVSEAPISEAPLSMRVARVSGGAGPGYRLLDDKETLWVKLEGPGAVPCRVLRLSLAAVWIINEAGVEYVLHEPVRVTLSAPGREIGPLLSQVVAVHPAEGDEPPLVGLQLIGVTLAVGRQILELVNALVGSGAAEPARSLVMSREHIDAAERVKAVIGMLINAGGEASLQGGEIQVQATKIEAEPEARILWKSPKDWGEPPYSVEMVGYNSIHRLTLNEARRVGPEIIASPIPPYVERIRHRWFRRVTVRGEVTVHFRHPLWPELTVQRRKVRDISYAGLSFEADRDEDLIFPGLEITELVVEAGTDAVIRLRGQIRFVSQPKEKSELSLCGMSVTPRSVSDEPRWALLVSQELHATLKSDVGAPEPVWRLFESSGYFQLSGKNPAHFEPLKSSFMTVGHRAVSAPRLMWQVVWPSQRGVEASISLLKAYYGTWMVHQLAKRPGRAPGVVDSRQILRDIYLRALEHPQFDPDFHWMMAYVDMTVAWSRMCHLDFATRHESTGLALVRPFRLMEVSSAEADDIVASDIQVGKATFEEEEILLHHIRSVRPESFTEPLDFTQDLLQLTFMTRAWREIGFERERGFLVARRRREPIAMAVLESGESGTNLFRLLDSTRVFALAPDGKEAFPALLSAARAWYIEKGKPAFVYLHEHEDDEAVDLTRFRSLGEGAFWSIHALLLPDFLEHVYEMTAPRKKTDGSTAK